MKKKLERLLDVVLLVTVLCGFGFIGGVIYEQSTTPEYWEFTFEPEIFYYYNDTLIPEQLFDTVTYYQKRNRSIRIYKPTVFPEELQRELNEFYTDEFMDEFIYNKTHDEVWTKIF